MQDVIDSVRSIDPWAAENIADVCHDLDFYIIFNQARSGEQAHLGAKLQATGKKFLNLNLHYAGMIFHNEEVPASVQQMKPISLSHPDSISTRILQRISSDIFTSVTQGMDEGKRLFNKTEDLQRVLQQAQKDFQSNLLTQRRLQRQRDSSTAGIGV